MGTFVKVAALSQLEEGRGVCVEAGGCRIGLFKVGDAVHAIDDLCTHAEASLCDGEVQNGEVLCPLHYATFDLATGACTGPPASEDVRTYQVRIEGEDVLVEV